MERDVKDPFRTENNVRVRDLVIKYGEADDTGRKGFALIELAARFKKDYQEPLGGIYGLSVEKLLEKMSAVCTQEWVVERMGDGVDYVIVSVETLQKTREVGPDTSIASRPGSAAMQTRVTSCGVAYRFSPVKNEVVDRSMRDQQQIEEPVPDPVQYQAQDPVQKPSGNSLLDGILSMYDMTAVTSSPSVPCPTLTTPTQGFRSKMDTTAAVTSSLSLSCPTYTAPELYQIIAERRPILEQVASCAEGFKNIANNAVSACEEAIRIAKESQEEVRAANASAREAEVARDEALQEADEANACAAEAEGWESKALEEAEAANARASEAEEARDNAERSEKKALQEVDAANARAAQAEYRERKALQEVEALRMTVDDLQQAWLASLSSIPFSTPSRSSLDSI